MNQRLMVLAVAGAVVLAGCARMMAQHPKGEATETSSQLVEAKKQDTPKAEPSKPKPKPVPRTAQPRH